MPQEQTYTIEDIIREEATKRGLPPELALAVAEQESSFNPAAVGPPIKAGPAKGQRAIGVFQLIPSTAAMLNVKDPTDPVQNIDGGLRYLSDLMDRHQGDVGKVLTEYGGVVHDTKYVPSVLQRMERYRGGANTTTPVAIDAASDAVPTPDQGPPEATATTRFLDELSQSLVVEPVLGIAGLLKGAVTDPSGTAKAVVKAIFDPTMRHLEAATAARRAGEPGKWVSEMLRAVPIIGPIGEQIGEQIESGDVAGGLGRSIGTAGTFAIPKTLGRVFPEKTTSPIPLLRSERTGSAVSQFLEHLAERTIPGKGRMRWFREQQQAALQKYGEDLASELSAAKGSTDVGQAMKRAIDTSLAARKAEAAELYSAIDDYVATETRRVPVTREVPSKIVGPSGEPLTVTERTLKKVEVGGVQPETRVLKQAAIPLLRRIRTEAQLLPPQELARASVMLDRIVKAPPRLPFSAFQDARSDLLRIVRSIGDPLPGKAGGVAKLLAEKSDDAMMAAARRSGITELPELVREANALWKETASIFKDPFLKKVAKESPEAIPTLMKMADVDELHLLEKAVGTDVFKQGSARVVRDVIAEATSQPPMFTPPTWSERFGVTPSGAPVVHGPRLQGEVIHKTLQRMGPEKAKALFGDDVVSGLEDLANFADRVSPQQVDRVAGGLVAAGLNASLLAPIMGPILRPAGVVMSPSAWAVSAAYAATAATSLNLLARVITKPQGMTTFRAFLRAIGSGRNPEAVLLGTRLASQVSAAEESVMPAMPSHEPAQDR